MSSPVISGAGAGAFAFFWAGDPSGVDVASSGSVSSIENCFAMPSAKCFPNLMKSSSLNYIVASVLG